jgi:hypothetical protein
MRVQKGVLAVTQCSLTSFARILACCALVVLCLGFSNSAVAAGPQAQSAPDSTIAKGPKIWLQESQSLNVTHVGPAASGMTAGEPLSMVAADIDYDGVQDLLVGYRTPSGGVVVLHRGNLDAFAPQSEASFQAITNSQFPSPFLPEARTFAVPVTPDFMAVGDFTGHGVTDLAVSARGGSAIYILPGDGKGNFGAGETINLPGGVTALAADRFGKIQSALLVGVSSGRQSFLAVYGRGEKGLTPLAALPLQAPASNILFGEFGDLGPDAALLSGGQVFILRSSTMQLVNAGLPVQVSAFALGFFLFDRNGGSQIALLGVDGSIQIAVRNEFDPRSYTNEEFRAIRQARLNGETPPLVPAHTFAGNGWRIAEGFPGMGAVTPGQSPVFFRTRISVNGADDILWLNAANGQMVLISHPDQQPGAATFLPGQVSVKPYNGSPFHGLPMRTNADGRFGIVALHQGQTAPAISAPIPDPVFTVNRFDDPAPPATITNACNGVANDCSLREAILRANGDTVMVPAGTYTLSIAKVANDCTGKFGALSVDHTATIIGSVDGTGKPTSIIQAGTTSFNPGPANGVDMVMNVNEDLGTAGCPITNASASLSNLVLQNGHNRGTHGNDGDGGCMEFDTGSSGTATLTLTNVTLQNCNTTQGSGGGLASFNFEVATGTGQAIIINSIIQGNSVADNSGGSSTAAGGGIWVSDPSRMTMTNSQVLNNLAIQDTATTGIGHAGGLFIFSKGTAGQTPQTQIHSSIISGNKAAFAGGGIEDEANVLIDSGTIISGNKNGQGASGTHTAAGGGLFVNPPVASVSATLSKVTIINNQSTGTGGGIATGAIGAGPVTFTFSRLKGNTAGTTGSNLENLGSTVTATHNWWATNTAGSTIHTTAGTTTFDPFLVLTHTAAPNLIRIGDLSSLTANFLHDNHGSTTGITASNLDVLSGLPITFDNANHGNISNAPPAIGNQVAITSVSQTGCTPTTFQCTATVTVTTTTPHNFSPGQNVTIAGVTDPSYDGVFAIASTPTPTTFTYSTQDAVSSSSGGGTASVPTGTATATYTATSGGIDNVHATVDGVVVPATITVLFPPSIAKAFTATHIPVFSVTPTTTTLTFTISNPNTANGLNGLAFTDTLPSGLAVANTPAVSNTCNGSVTAAAGSNSISLSGGTITFNGGGTATCTVSVDVKGVTDGIQNNTSGNVTATDAGGLTGNTASASITVINPPQIAKAFGAATIPVNGTTSLTFTLTSSNANLSLNGVAFNDNLPAGLVNATPSSVSDNCGGTAAAADGGTSVSLTGAALAPGASCTVSLNVQGTTAGIKNNSVQVTSTDVGGLTGNTGNASITVVGPPTIAKAFGAATIPLNGSTSLSFTINNPNSSQSLSGVAFSDTLPAGLVVSTPNGQTGSCGSGTITATAGTNTISLSGGTLAASGSCTFAVNVTGTAAGAQNNTTGTVSSTEGGTGGTAAASVTVVAPPSIAKAFNPISIAVGANSQLTFTITNPGANAVSLTGVGFTDTLPTGLVVATPNGLTNSCGGTATATAAGTSISLTGGSIAAASACTVVVNITGNAAGQYVNTSGNVTSTNGGTGNAATASLTVASPPSIAKAFGNLTIPLGGSTSLTFTITNPDTIVLTGLAFTDSLPAGLVVATPPGTTDSCGGTVTAVAGSGSISLSGGTVAASTNCTVVVNVTGTTIGVKNNTSGAVSASEGGTGNVAMATLTVVTPPSIAKAFSPSSINITQTSTLTFTIMNPNSAVGFSNVAFSDTLPTGLTVADSTTTPICGAGTLTTTAATGVITLSGGTIASASQCTIPVTVTGAKDGVWVNITGAVSSLEGGTGNTATDILTVGPQPTFSKAFTNTSVALNQNTRLTFTIQNGTTIATLTNLQFTDSLPAGLQVAALPNLASDCSNDPTPNASVSTPGVVTATPNATSISLTGLGLTNSNGGSCTIKVDVTGITPGHVTNNATISSDQTGNPGPTATVGLDIVAPPSLAKAFNPSAIPLGATTTLTFTITNPVGNAVQENGVAFSDTLPTNLVVATPNGLINTCGGTPTATAGSASIDFVGGTIAVNSSCTVVVNVTGSVAGQYTNTSGNVSSTNGGTGNAATANLTIDAPPTITKAFGAPTIPLNGTTSLTLNITNPNSTGLTGVGFSDNLPSGLVVATPPGVTNNCSGGSVTAISGSGSVGLSGASLAGSGSCTVTVNVQGTTAGVKNNSVQATSTEGGTGATGNASITVVAPPTITKAFGGSSVALNNSTSLTFTLNNPNSSQSLSGVAFSDTLPAGLIISTPNGLTGSCGSGTITAVQGTNTISLSGGTLAGPGSCSFSLNVTGTTPGQQINTTSTVTSTEGGTGTAAATASITVVAPPSIGKAFNPTAIGLNGITTLTFTITNPAANNVAEAGVAFNDTLPTGLTVATPNGLTNNCGGTATATAGTTGIALSGGSIGVNTSCTMTVTVVGNTQGVYTNTSGAVTSTNGGTGNTATAGLTVAEPLLIAKAFNPTTIPLNANSTLTFTITNPPANNFALAGVAFTDTLPAGMVVATPNGLTSSCGGTATAVAGSNSITLSGGAIPINSACNLAVTVTGTAAGALVNTSGTVSSTNGGSGNTATATLNVSAASTSTAVVSSSNPSVFGQGVTFTATVTNSSGSTGQPTGTVQFVVDGSNFGPAVPLTGASSTSSTAASQVIATLPVTGSPHTVTANYLNADGNFVNSSGSVGGGQTVTIASTTTAVVSSSNPSVFGQPVMFTATVTDSSLGSTAQPTGSVQFVVDGVNFGTPAPLAGATSNSSTAPSQQTAALSIAGSPHSVSANYVNADGNFSNSSASLSGGQTVGDANTTTTVNSSSPTITLGDTVTFTATVAANPPATGTPTGLVTFLDGTTAIGSGKLNQGNPDQATFSTALLAQGTHFIIAVYQGDADFTATSTSPITEVVNLRGSTTTLALNPTTVSAGQPSTTTVTVADSGSNPPGTPNVFSPTGAPATGRTGFTSTLIADGLVLVAGGTGANGTTVLNSAEIYSVTGAGFTTTGNLNTARTGAVAVLLSNGKVLVAGGSSSLDATGALNTAELFDPNTGTFTPTSHNMTAARFGTAATLLETGKILLAGGTNSGGVLNSAELYDPSADTFTATGNLNTARTGASATLLGNGKVLVAGGSSNGTTPANGALNGAELFDPAGNGGAGTFTPIASPLGDFRWQPEAALLLSGKVLVAGGQNAVGALASADLYDPVGNSFAATSHQMNEVRANGSAVALPSGMVLLAGGTTSQIVDLYQAESDTFAVTGSLLQHDSGLVATLLNNGDVLVVGLSAVPASDAELYSPSFNPLGTVGFGSSDGTDVFGPACVLSPSTSTTSTCASSVTPGEVGTSPHTIAAKYPADAVHSNSANSASLTVIPTAPPAIAKNFGAANVAQNGTVNVSFTIVNPNPAATLTGISFTDALPAGLVVATPNNLNSNCGGTFTAVPGSSSMSLTGGTVAPAGPPPPLIPHGKVVQGLRPMSNGPASGQCVISVDLLVTGTGTISNTTGTISANESGPGNPSNTATIQVVLAPTLNKVFGAANIPTGGTTSLTFNIANPNTTVSLVGIALTDTLPSGLIVATPNGATGSCLTVAASVTTAGTLTAVAASGSISLSNLSLSPSGSCSVSVNVTGTSGGTKLNTTAPITGTFDDGSGIFRLTTGGTASASIVVVAPPAISKAFVPVAIAPGGVSTLTFTITNPAVNTAAENGVAFTDTLPANVVIATPNGLSGSCGGTVTATAGTGSVSLAGGTVAAASSCTFSVNVTASVLGEFTNITGAVSSTNGGTGNTATANLFVGHANLSLTKTHVGNFPRNSTNNNYTITVSNDPAAAPTVGTVTVVDTLPNVNNTLVATAMTGTGWSCNLGTLTCTRSDSLAPGTSYPPITLTVTVPQNIQANVVNSATVSGGNDVNSHTANDPTHIGSPVQLTTAGSADAQVVAGGVTSVVINVDSSAGEGMLTLACGGLPKGAACSFNPPTTTALTTQVTVIIGTTLGVSSARPPASGPGLGVYAILFPVFGLVLVGAGVKSDRRRLRRMVVVLGLALLLTLLALSGCGGPSMRSGTPAAFSQVTVTATSATTGDSGSTTINLTVLSPAPTSH